MNISYNWLKDFVDHDLTPNALRDLITSRAATVDAVEALREDLKPFVVARVLECAPHPDSDHLSVTKVDAGTGELLDVVCGAPNVQAGKMYPFAKTGTKMPAGFTIERRKIRGAISNGMLCSAREIGLGDEQDGIMELDIDVAPGTPLLTALPSISDSRIVVDVGANRPDLLSHLGVAREVAAALGKPVDLERATHASRPPVTVTTDPKQGSTGGVSVIIEDVDGCPRYLGVVVRGVKIGPSPDWLARRLEGAGVRSINNIVDITNFMLLGFGQPMHAFDAKRLAGPAIIVRRAKKGEKLKTLDGAERALTEDMCVIADANSAQALAGVMGGHDSEVTPETTDIFLEVAAFNPRRVRQMRRALSLSTEASYRFERGTDVVAAPERLQQAVALIVALAGGVPESAIDVYPTPEQSRALTVRASRIKQVLGEQITASRVVTLLRSIGFAADVRPGTEMLKGNEEITAVAPSWRGDVVAEIDVVEEVARLHGYDTFSDELRPFRVGNVPDSPEFALETRIQDALAAEGLFEIRPLPFVAGMDATHVRVSNPIAENEAHLRTSIVETLASRAAFNLAHMEGNIRLFEVGAVFTPRGDGLPEERKRVGVLVMGDRRPSHFTEPKPQRYDHWDAKGLAERLVQISIPGARASFDPANADAQTRGELWTIHVDGAPRGTVRTVALDAPVWASTAYGIELDLGVVDSTDVAPPGKSIHGQTPYPTRSKDHAQYKPLPSTPASQIDLALIVPDGKTAADVERVIRSNGGELLERLSLFDEFRGQGLPPGTRSLAWRLTFRDATRTLRDKEIEGRTNKILKALEGELGVRQRTA